MAKENRIQIKLKKSLIGSNKNQIKVARALGLTKLNQIVEHNESATIVGMVNKIPHLVEIVK